MKNILVTGGRGFIGFNAINLWRKLYPDYQFVEIDNDTYADRFLEDEKNKFLDDNDVPRFVLDLGADDAVRSLIDMIETFQIDTIIHFGCESHVDNSLTGPEVFFNSNVMGTVHILEAVRKTGVKLLQVSTDEVYGISYPETEIIPESILDPSSPYSSSKASADLITLSYAKSFGIDATITRCCNNFGFWQHSEKLIPTIIRKLEHKEMIPVYGDGKQYRQWIHVDDHNRAIMDVLHNKPTGNVVHFSSNRFGYMRNIDLISIFADIYGRKLDDIVEYVKDRPAHDTSYYLTHYTSLDYSESHIRDMLAKTCDSYRNIF